MASEQQKVLLTRRDLLKTGAAAAVIAGAALRTPGSTALAGTAPAPPGAWNHDPASPIGPRHWADIGFPICGQGMSQSPVDIRTDQVAAYHGAPLLLRYESSELAVENTGHVVEVPIPADVHDTPADRRRPLFAGAVPLPRPIRARRQRPAGGGGGHFPHQRPLEQNMSPPPDRSLEDSMRAPIPARLLLLAMVCSSPPPAGAPVTTPAAPLRPPPPRSERDHGRGVPGLRRRGRPEGVDGRARPARPALGRQGRDPGRPGQGQANLAALRGSATGQWGSQITELDGAVEALKTTIAGISGDSLVSDLPTIVSDLQRIDTAWTALQQQIDQDCG